MSRAILDFTDRTAAEAAVVKAANHTGFSCSPTEPRLAALSQTAASQCTPRRWASVLLAITVSAWLGTEAAGEQMTRLTHDGRIKFSPVFWNAEELVYVDFEQPELTTLKVLKLADRSSRRLHPQATTQELEPAFSPDGRWCAFPQARGTLSLALVLRDEIANRDFEVPPAGGFSGYRSPAFSPDGKRVAYSFAEGGLQNLYTVNSRAQDRKQLTANSGINNWPCYSADGQRILFASTRDGNFEIYRMDFDGTHVCRLTDCPYQDLRPRYSPDGRRIAFTSGRDRNYEVYVMCADGSAVTRVTKHDERDDYPAWSPNGRQLVVVSERDGQHDLYLLDVE